MLSLPQFQEDGSGFYIFAGTKHQFQNAKHKRAARARTPRLLPTLPGHQTACRTATVARTSHNAEVSQSSFSLVKAIRLVCIGTSGLAVLTAVSAAAYEQSPGQSVATLTLAEHADPLNCAGSPSTRSKIGCTPYWGRLRGGIDYGGQDRPDTRNQGRQFGRGDERLLRRRAERNAIANLGGG